MNSITNFFKPVPKTTASQASGSVPTPRQSSRTPARPSRTPPAPRPSTRTPTRSSQLPPPPSSPPPPASSSPDVPVPVRQRDAVIKGSDDEDDDSYSSDDDFPSLFTKPKASGGPVTPRAKRAAISIFSSPLTIQPKHKFDFKALMKHAQADNALEASELRVESVLSRKSPATETKASVAKAIAASEKRVPTSLHDNMLDVLSSAEGSQDEGNREKLLRAVKRSEATAQRQEYFFFDDPAGQDPETASIRVRGTFPKAAATGPWKFLAAAKNRADLFEDGIPYQVQTRLQNIPDEIYLWILAEIPIEPCVKLRGEYLRLLEVCKDQAGRLINESLLVKIFQETGASERALGLAPRTGPSTTENSRSRGYQHEEVDWTTLEMVLEILQRTSGKLSLDPRIYAFAVLLRLGMDMLIREDLNVHLEYQDTLWWLAKEVSGEDWDKFCGEVCNSLYTHVAEYSLRWDAVSAIPLTHHRLIDLRRRLAIAFIFDDPKRGVAPPETTFSVHAVNDRLETDTKGTFAVHRQRDDYYELAALTGLLTVAIGDGNPPPADGPADAIEQYNEDVDQLTKRISIMWSNIFNQGATMVSKVEARIVLKDLERKLEYGVRTRRLPKSDIFGIQTKSEGVDERVRPQQNFMKRFLGKDVNGKRERSPSLPVLPKVEPAS